MNNKPQTQTQAQAQAQAQNSNHIHRVANMILRGDYQAFWENRKMKHLK